MIESGPKASRTTDHPYYYAVSIMLVVVVFTGFARTYYLKGSFGASPLSLLLHIHGAVMTLWYALFVAQVSLVATHRVALHRKLGIAGAGLASLVAILSTMVSFGLAKRELLAHPDSTEAPMLLGLQLFAIVLVFVILVSLGVCLRRRPGYHKRLMVLAMLSLLGPAITRLPLSFIANHDASAAAVIAIGLVLACVLVDTARNRRLHPAFGWGGSFVIGSIFVVFPFAQSSLWIRTVRWLLL